MANLSAHNKQKLFCHMNGHLQNTLTMTTSNLVQASKVRKNKNIYTNRRFPVNSFVKRDRHIILLL